MDPLTASLNLATAALALATKIWDATPDALKAQSAGDWAKFIHNIAAVIIDIQVKINAAAAAK